MVSIRPQHYCWGIHIVIGSHLTDDPFQSAPSITAGGFPAMPMTSTTSSKFQSAPSITAGGFIAAIATRVAYQLVSIRPQHYCWGIHADWIIDAVPPLFQSAPSITAGGFLIWSKALSAIPWFQSAPSITAGGFAMACGVFGVSKMFQSAPSITAGGFSI